METTFQQLRETVQANCHISDAAHAGNYTLCIYLMKMREYFRWETGEPFSAPLPHKEVGSWLKNREKLWDQLEEQEFRDLTINEQSFNPFESEQINQQLDAHGLIYSGGLGVFKKPHFFLARLESKQQHDGYTVLVSGEEYARDLTSPPGMTQGKTVYIRRESLRRLLWEKLETWNWNQPDNAMGRALGFYNFQDKLDESLDQMTENELQTMLLHEIGEIKAGQQLGEHWEQLLSRLSHTKAEIMLRAIRDHLADALSTLPGLVEKRNDASIHFYMGNLNNMRKDLYPSLVKTYEKWMRNGDYSLLKTQNDKGLDHWLSLCQQVMSQSSGIDKPQKTIEDLIESHRL